MAVKNGAYDLFISYSRKDNQNGLVDKLISCIEQIHEEGGQKRKLCIFFDRSEIVDGDIWPAKLRKGLYNSYIMLVVLSENYLNSKICKEEWDYFHSVHYFYDGQEGILPILLSDISEDTLDDDLRTFFEKIRLVHADPLPATIQSPSDLENEEIQDLLKKKYAVINNRLREAEFAARVPVFGSFKERNPYFVGRTEEIAQIVSCLDVNSKKAAIISGLSGLGKSELANEAAHRLKSRHLVGIMQVNAQGYEDLKKLIIDTFVLSPAFNPEYEQWGSATISRYRNSALGWEKAKTIIHERIGDLIADTSADTGRANLLLILDNVDRPVLLSAEQLGFLTLHGDDLHHVRIMATTTYQPGSFPGITNRAADIIELAPLNEADATKLLFSRIDQHETPLDRSDWRELEAAERIANDLLNGFTIAIEQIAVYANKYYGRPGYGTLHTFVEMEKVIRTDGLLTFDEWMQADPTSGAAIRHQEKVLGLVLEKFTLAEIAREPGALTALCYAAMMPDFRIDWEWLEDFVPKAQLPKQVSKRKGTPHGWGLIRLMLEERMLIRTIPESPERCLGQMHVLVQVYIRNKYIKSPKRLATSITKDMTEYFASIFGKSDPLKNRGLHYNFHELVPMSYSRDQGEDYPDRESQFYILPPDWDKVVNNFQSGFDLRLERNREITNSMFVTLIHLDSFIRPTNEIYLYVEIFMEWFIYQFHGNFYYNIPDDYLIYMQQIIMAKLRPGIEENADYNLLKLYCQYLLNYHTYLERGRSKTHEIDENISQPGDLINEVIFLVENYQNKFPVTKQLGLDLAYIAQLKTYFSDDKLIEWKTSQFDLFKTRLPFFRQSIDILTREYKESEYLESVDIHSYLAYSITFLIKSLEVFVKIDHSLQAEIDTYRKTKTELFYLMMARGKSYSQQLYANENE